MNFRVSVESIICREYENNIRKILLVKRASDCKVAPNVWNVPAGKVNMLETTYHAVVRETFEETHLQVKMIKMLAEHAFQITSDGQPAYRNMFTYLTHPIDDNQEVLLNHEHTEFKWVTKEEIDSETYHSLMPRLKKIIMDVFDNHD